MASMYDHRPEGKRITIIEECKHCGEWIYRGDAYNEINEGIVHEGCYEEYKATMEYQCIEMENKLNEIYDLSKNSSFDFINPVLMKELRIVIGSVLLKIENREEHYGE